MRRELRVIHGRLTITAIHVVSVFMSPLLLSKKHRIYLLFVCMMLIEILL